MIKKCVSLLKSMKSWRLASFIYYNYICKAIIRTDNSKIIPYKGAVIDIGQDAKVVLGGGDLEVGCDLVKGSKTETRVRLRDGAVLSNTGGIKLSYGTTLEILDKAVLDSGYFTVNSNSTIVVAKRLVIGNDVMIARNVVIFDSDFHSILNDDNEVCNPPSPVEIGDHVWLGANSIVLKGSSIGRGSIIGAGTVVHGRIEKGVILNTTQQRELRGKWTRKAP